MRARVAATALACMFALAQVVVAHAATATATSDLVAGPPDSTWEQNSDISGPRSKEDIWGNQAGSIQGFVDAYEKAWAKGSEQGLVDRLEKFSSVFWAAFRLSDSKAAAKDNTKHSSYQDLKGVGTSAYEVTDPADADGFLSDTIVFTFGDYVGVVVIVAKTTPDHAALMGQAHRQAALIPEPVGEYNAIGQGIFNGIAIIGVIAGVITLIVVAIVLVVVLRRRSRPVAASPYLSPDGRWWWDGTSWQPRPPT